MTPRSPAGEPRRASTNTTSPPKTSGRAPAEVASLNFQYLTYALTIAPAVTAAHRPHAPCPRAPDAQSRRA